MFDADPYCIKYDIRIKTYEVVPLSSSAGIIKWVDNTIPLVGCYKADPGFEKDNLASKKAFEKMITKRKGSSKGFIDCLSFTLIF
jgi:phosphatidylinositol kinase/protein kinase (PI-3  family)